METFTESFSSCPFSTNKVGNIEIPPVPVTIGPNVTFVPSPSGDITKTAQNNKQTIPMGSTTAPTDSSRNTKGWLENQIYQVRAPHPQNTLEPCSVVGKAPLMEQKDNPFDKNNLLADPNTRARKCYNIYDIGQGMVGRVCTKPGVDDKLDSREVYDGEGINGNAEWVRGNRFGVSYTGREIKDPVKYSYKVPALLSKNKEYINYDPFYPKLDRCLENNCWFKTYPRDENYTKGGYPKWRYPYETTQPDSRNSVYRLSSLEQKKDIDKIIERFSHVKVKDVEDDNPKVCFWLGVFVIFGSLIYLTGK
jgi:hypothetical protein